MIMRILSLKGVGHFTMPYLQKRQILKQIFFFLILISVNCKRFNFIKLIFRKTWNLESDSRLAKTALNLILPMIKFKKKIYIRDDYFPKLNLDTINEEIENGTYFIPGAKQIDMNLITFDEI